MADTELYALRDSAVVSAGAGTGKTHSLVTLCLHLLGGVGREAPLPPARLWAVTFTEKAAAELKGRLRLRIEALAGGADASAEPELFAACAEAGSAPPPPGHWQRVRRDLTLAQIGTIHALCAQILRRHAAAAGVTPGFSVLDEVDARRALRECCEEATLSALSPAPGASGADDTDSLRVAAERLCAELGFRGPNRFQRGLAEELMKLLSALGESGTRPSDLLSARAGSLADEVLSAEAAARRALCAAVERVAALGGKSRTAAVERAGLAAARFREQTIPALAATGPGELSRIWPQLDALRDALGPKGQTERGLAVEAVKDALLALAEADAQVRALGLSRDLVALADDALSRYRAQKRRAGALDFDDLTRLAGDLLAASPEVRRAEKARIGALLVDEFQDTSRAQLRLFGWLAEPPSAEGTAPAGCGLPGALPIAQGRFLAVGDRKQSIYEFRGADVAGAQAFVAQAVRDGAKPFVLRRSRRSRPALVAFCNALFSQALGHDAFPFHTPFRPGEDDLEAHRPEGPPGACAELLQVAATGPDAPQAEADAVARRIAQLLAEGAPERVHERSAQGEVARAIRGGDVAILLRAFTHVDAYRRALLRLRIPHLVWQGRGFYAAREVRDLLALLQVVADPDDARALATVLRSPLGPLSDDALVLLARGRLSRAALHDDAVLDTLSPDDAHAARAVDALLVKLGTAAARLGPAALLTLALGETDVVAAYAAGLHGEQAAANVEKLLALARAAELRGASLRDFLARTEALLEEEAREPDAGVVEERDPHAVRILTVHAAKGLEFPVVFVPECGAATVQTNDGAVLLDPDLGLAIRVAGADGEPRWGVHGNAVRERRKQRELAQGRRLLYVAATRARDLVVFSAREARGGEPWRLWLDQAAASPACSGLLRSVQAAELAAPPRSRPRSFADGVPGLAEALLEKTLPPGEWPAADGDPVLPAPAAPPASASPPEGARRAPEADLLVVPVTQLADASLCPRRYQLLHELGLPEHAGEEPEARPEAADGSPTMPATRLGTLAHALLERAPIEARLEPTGLRRALRKLATDEGADLAAPDVAEVVRSVEKFLLSPLGLRLSGPEARFFRELPFALQLDPAGAGAPGVLLRGQIDALLLEPAGALVLDYKHARRRSAARYEPQLDAYALAAHALTEGALPVRTSLVFLKSPGPGEPPREAPDAAGRERLRAQLSQAGALIAQGRRTGLFPLVPAPACQRIECGFLQRCHGREPRAQQSGQPRGGQLALPL